MVAPRVELESEERTHLGQSAILHIRWNPCTDRYFRAGTPQSTDMGQPPSNTDRKATAMPRRSA
jgi:hypothetical protein